MTIVRIPIGRQAYDKAKGTVEEGLRAIMAVAFIPPPAFQIRRQVPHKPIDSGGRHQAPA